MAAAAVARGAAPQTVTSVPRPTDRPDPAATTELGDAGKRALGSFYTVGNPFVHTGFLEWMATVPTTDPFLEPFAGSGQIPRLMTQAGHHATWTTYDIDPALTGVIHRDTIADFPTGHAVAISNPPYLSYHFAVRKGLHVVKGDFAGYPSLYLTAISRALSHCGWVAFVIPESFATTGLFTSRLEHLISLPFAMFDDTDMPTCLALWGPSPSPDFKVWRGSDLLGTASELLDPLTTTPCGTRIVFNRADGQLGLRAVDDTRSASIAFGGPELCPDDKVKPSGRLLSRIHVTELTDVDAVCAAANELLAQWRTRTADFGLTAFKGVREDGLFRRRLDFASARALLSQALCAVEGHTHPLQASLLAD